MGDPLVSLHIIGSKAMGGAERFFYRLVSALNSNNHEAIAVARKGSEVARVAPPGITVQTSFMRTVWDPISRAHIGKIVKRVGPHVVQTYMGRATRLTRLKEGSLPIHISRLGGYYKLDGYRHAHAWIGNTRGICGYLASEGFPKRRIFFAPNFIDPVDGALLNKKAEIRRTLNLPLDAFIVLTAGRFIPIKGHRYLIEAFSRLPLQVKGRATCLVLLGDGPLNREYADMVQRHSMGTRVIMPGWVHEPIRYFVASDVVVFPSLEHETLGNVVLEAWAAKRPVVVSRFRGAREITRHGEDVLQVPCEDSASIKEAILRLLNDKELRESLSERGHDKVLKEYSRERVVTIYEEIYTTLCRAIMGGVWY